MAEDVAMLDFMAQITDAHAQVSAIGAGILAACHLDIAHDSRSFAAKIGIAHALVLRECTVLQEEGWLVLESKQDRSERVFFKPTERACESLRSCEGL